MKRNKKKDFFNHINQFKKDPDDGGNGGGSNDGGNPPAIDTNSQEFKDAVQSAVSKEVTGLKNKNDELLNTISDQKQQLKQFEGLDAEKIKGMMTHFENNEEAQLIADGKIDDVIQRRTDKIQGQFTDQITELNTTNETLAQENAVLKQQLENSVIGNALRAEAAKSGVMPEAVDDILMRGLNIFSLDDKSEIVARDADGNLVKLEDNMLLTPERYIESLRKTNPYYWPTSSGSGGKGSANASQQSKDQLDKLTDLATSSGGFDLTAYRAAKGKK